MIRFVKRAEFTRKKGVQVRLSAVLLALFFAGVVLAIAGFNPFEVYTSMVDGAFGSGYRINKTIVRAIPLLVTSLGLTIAFRMQFWNIGGEGQIVIGSIFASYLALNFSDWPPLLLLPLMMAAGMLGGALWALIPAVFRAYWRTNETIVTLLMNYVAFQWLTFLQYGPWKDPAALGHPKIANFTSNASLPELFGIHIGWLIGLVLVIVVHLFLNHSKKGYEISVLGESEKTAQYAGMNIKRIILIAVGLSGAVCGLTGMIEASGRSHTLHVHITDGVGYTAIIVSWLSRLSAPAILIVSILFAGLIEGGSFIQMAFKIPEAAAQLLQALILLFVLGGEFFIRYRLDWKKKTAEPAAAAEGKG